MKVRVIFFVLFIVLNIVSKAQTGLLKVKATDENNLNLPGAIVKIDGTKISAVTDASGWSFLYNVAIGKQKVIVSYIGYTETSQIVDVKAGTVEVIVSLKSGVSVLNGVVVLGDRLKGQAKALNQQKNAANIVNVISADQIGRFPDANIGDAVKRVAGVTMQNDQGEARDIIIRGMAPQLNAVTLNGDRIPSAEGDNRKVQMDLIPSDMVQTVEVSKTLTPDMDGDAIGGSVNLVTRTAPNKLRVSGMGSFGNNPIRDGAINNLSIVAGGRLLKSVLGLVGTVVINDNNYGSDNIEAVWQQTSTGAAYVGEHDIRRYDIRRVRRSFNLNGDIKINKNNTINFSTIYNWRDDWENRYRLRITGITPQANGTFIGEIRKQTKAGISGNRIKNARLEEQIVKKNSIAGEHIIVRKIKVDWSTSFAQASENRPNERYLEYNATNQIMTMDITDPERPYVAPTTRVNTSSFGFRRFTEQFGETNEKEWSNKLNIKVPLELIKDKKTVLKIGGKYTRKEKVRINDFYRYALTANTTPVFNATGVRMAGLAVNNLTVTNFQPGTKYLLDSFVSPQFVGSYNLYTPGAFTVSQRPEEFLALNYNADEKISSGYISINQTINSKLSVITGVRFEKTEIDYTGNIVLNTTTFKGDTSATNSYSNLLPSINIKYDLNSTTVLRAAITTALARPGYYELVPYRNIVSADKQVTVGNASLKATTATNFDLMGEKYFKSIGVVSGGIFYKKLKNFIYTYSTTTYTSANYQNEFNPTTGDNPIPVGENWVYKQSRNGESVDVYGFEIAYQRQLDFLPGFWKGFGVYVNYTYSKSKADGIYNTEGVKRDGLALPGTAPHIFNASLSFENRKFVARLSGNFTASYLDEVGATSFQDRFYDKQFFLDFNTSYTITPKLRAFLEVNNITNQPLRYYTGSKERTAQLEFYRSRWNTGIKFDIF